MGGVGLNTPFQCTDTLAFFGARGTVELGELKFVVKVHLFLNYIIYCTKHTIIVKIKLTKCSYRHLKKIDYMHRHPNFT